MNVYLAGASAEIERALRIRDQLMSAGIGVTSTWMDRIPLVGEANPRSFSRLDRFEIVEACLAEVDRSDWLWFLAPPHGLHTCGAWCELIAAYRHIPAICVISSGDSKRSVFGAVGIEFDRDEHALAVLLLAASGVPICTGLP